MKKWALLSIAVFLLLAGTGVTQNWDERLTVYVPFEFVMGDTVLPAGTYFVGTQMGVTTRQIRVKNTETGVGAYSSNTDIIKEANARIKNSNLVFVRDASGRNVLHQIWIGNDRHGHDLVHKEGLSEPR